MRLMENELEPLISDLTRQLIDKLHGANERYNPDLSDAEFAEIVQAFEARGVPPATAQVITADLVRKAHAAVQKHLDEFHGTGPN